jgi:cyclic di-GMP phosphodiesterase
VIRYHHERWDGSGYPVGLKKEEIPIQARIFAIADVFDALTSKRTYRKKSTAEEAIQYLKEQSGILFDPLLVEALAKLPYKEFTEGEKITA